MRQNHTYHLVDPSPWPLLISLSLWQAATLGASRMHEYLGEWVYVSLNLGLTACIMGVWLNDVVKEGSFLKHHQSLVEKGLRLGFSLFIISEVMFFFSFFWAYFHLSLAPSTALGCVWPPVGIDVLDPFSIPLLNTAFLLTSGATITLTHLTLIQNKHRDTVIGFIATLILAVFFTGFQFLEYVDAPFGITDGAYGSLFYVMTGFHGLHVIIGTIFIFVTYCR